MNDIRIFNNAEFGEVRTLVIDNEPWFVGKDIAEILGYRETANMRKLIDELDYKEIDPQNRMATGFVQNGRTIEPNQNVRRMLLINESGLYQAIFNSILPNAKKFRRWVTSEVLPSIRKHGAYMMPDVLTQAIQDPMFMVGLLQELKSTQDKVKEQSYQLAEQAPKVVFADAVSTSDNCILIGDLAKILRQNGEKIGQNRLFERLRREGFLMTGGASHNMPTQRAMEMGLFKVKENVIANPDGSIRVTFTTKVTGKGQQYFINKFLRKN